MSTLTKRMLYQLSYRGCTMHWLVWCFATRSPTNEKQWSLWESNPRSFVHRANALAIELRDLLGVRAYVFFELPVVIVDERREVGRNASFWAEENKFKRGAK